MSKAPYKRYPAYKDSGVEWLGEIPAGWEVRRLKYVAALNAESLGESVDPAREICYVDIGGVNGLGQIVERERMTFGASPSRARRIVRDGDVIVSTVRTYLRAIAPISNPAHDMVVSTGFAVVRPSKQLKTGYAAYVMRAPFFVERVVANSKGVSFPATSDTELATYELTIPTELEQHAIVEFLDRETAEIDGLIAKKERLIELLQEQRASVITRAVTKGLDPNVPMKHSGVEWLGTVPIHWSVKRVKWAANMVSGHTPDKKVQSYWQGGDIPWVSLADTGQLRLVDYLDGTAVMTTADGIANSSAHVLPTGTVVFSRDATIGLCAITRAEMAVSQHFIGWVCHEGLKPEYLLHVLRSMTDELERLTMGATVKTIGMPDVRRLTVPIPPVPEQQKIVQYVLEERSKLDALIAKVREAIRHLTELRTALISAAVTGKIDVRTEVA